MNSQGRLPWDTATALRIGALVGGVGGAVVSLFAGLPSLAMVIIGAAVGAATGYWTEKRKQAPPDHKHSSKR